MRKFAWTAGTAVVAAAAAFVALPRASAQDGLPNVAGHWTGKAKVKEFYLTPAEKNAQDQFPVSCDITQVGGDVTIVFTVTGDEGVEVFNLTGKIGKGTLWATNGSATAPFVVSAHVDKKGRILRGTGFNLDAEEDEELNLHMKKQGGT
jgi:hypothetical protein